MKNDERLQRIAQEQNLGRQYQAITITNDNKAENLAAFTAAALKRMIQHDLDGNKEEVTKVFTLIQEVREEASIKENVKELEIQVTKIIEKSDKSKDSEKTASSIMLNPGLQRAILNNDKDDYQKSAEAAMKAEKAKNVSIAHIAIAFSGDKTDDAKRNIENEVNKVMSQINLQNAEPTIVRDVLVQMLRKREVKEEIIYTILNADLAKVKGNSVGEFAANMFIAIKDNKIQTQEQITSNKKGSNDKKHDGSKGDNKKRDDHKREDDDKHKSSDDLLRRIEALERENATLKEQLKNLKQLAPQFMTVQGPAGPAGASAHIMQGRDGKDGKDGVNAQAAQQSAQQPINITNNIPSSQQQMPQAPGGPGYGQLPQQQQRPLMEATNTPFSLKDKMMLAVGILLMYMALFAGALPLLLIAGLFTGLKYQDMKSQKAHADREGDNKMRKEGYDIAPRGQTMVPYQQPVLGNPVQILYPVAMPVQPQANVVSTAPNLAASAKASGSSPAADPSLMPTASPTGQSFNGNVSSSLINNDRDAAISQAAGIGAQMMQGNSSQRVLKDAKKRELSKKTPEELQKQSEEFRKAHPRVNKSATGDVPAL